MVEKEVGLGVPKKRFQPVRSPERIALEIQSAKTENRRDKKPIFSLAFCLSIRIFRQIRFVLIDWKPALETNHHRKREAIFALNQVRRPSRNLAVCAHN